MLPHILQRTSYQKRQKEIADRRVTEARVLKKVMDFM